MGLLDTAGGLLQDSDNVLGGKSHKAEASDAPLKYTREETEILNEAAPGAPGPTAPSRHDETPSPPNTINVHVQIEFIHFSWVHADNIVHFDHAKELKDDQSKVLPTDPAMPESRAIQFRAALEREAILLYGFISSCQKMLDEKEAAEGSKGAGATAGAALSKPGLGSALSAVSDLAGATGGSNAPKAADLNSMSKAVKTAAGNINATPAIYKTVHQTGVDLNQARANYRAFLDKVQKNPKGDADDAKKGGALSNLSGLKDAAAGAASAISGAMGAAGPIISLIQGIVFKAFDIYLAAYIEIAETQEYPIEKACHDLSMEAIKNSRSPIFPVWPIKNAGDDDNAADADDNDPLLSAGGAGAPSMDQQLKDAPDKIKKKAAKTATKMADDFLKETPPDTYWSQKFLDQAFSLDPKKDPNTPKSQLQLAPKELSASVLKAFKKALSLEGTSLGFADDIITEIVKMDLDFLQVIYQYLLAWDNTQPIPKEALYKAARTRLLDRLLALLMSKLSFLDSIKNFSLPFDDNKGKQGGKALDKATGMGKDELNEHFGKLLDPILDKAMANLCAELEAARKTAVAQNSMTMEVYLGLLPRELAVLFRDTFFPVWDLLVKEGCPWLSQLLGGPLGAAADAFKSLRKTAHDANDTLHRVKNVADQGSDLNYDQNDAVNGKDPLKKYKDAYRDGGIADDDDDSDAAATSDFPLSGRKAAATGGPASGTSKDDVDAVKVVDTKLYVRPSPKYEPAPAKT